jgi:hypothetical protein
MLHKKTPTTRVKAKSQKIVSRAVKQAGFKNIKEAKEVLSKCKAAAGKTCCAKDSSAQGFDKSEESYAYLQKFVTRQQLRIEELENLISEYRKALDEQTEAVEQDNVGSYTLNEVLYSDTVPPKQNRPQWTPFTFARDGAMVTIYVWGYEAQ